MSTTAPVKARPTTRVCAQCGKEKSTVLFRKVKHGSVMKYQPMCVVCEGVSLTAPSTASAEEDPPTTDPSEQESRLGSSVAVTLLAHLDAVPSPAETDELDFSLLLGLLRKLPHATQRWTARQRRHWCNAFEGVLDVLILIDDNA